MKFPWEDNKNLSPEELEYKRRYANGRIGGHHDSVIDEQMYNKNIDTAGGYQAKVTGDKGELALSSILKSLPDEYHVIDNVLLQTKKGSTQIDHIIVSRYGIFVVETKNHKGLIFGDDYGMVWTQVLNNGHFKFYNPVRQNQGHIDHLSKQLKISPNFMTGVIVFTNENANLANVNSSCCLNIDQFYYFINGFNKPLFSEKLVWQIIKRIDTINKDGYINRQKHIDYVNKKKAKRGW